MPYAPNPDVYTRHNISLLRTWKPGYCRFTLLHPPSHTMLLLRTLAPWLLLACLAQQVSLSTGARDGKGRKGKGGGGSKPEQPPTPAPGRAERAEKQGGGKGPATKGKFSTKDKMQCTWAARGEDTVTLAVNCKPPATAEGVSPFACNYRARPASCPGFVTYPAGYWKQVARAIKKLQRKLCKDQSALVKAGMCKRAPQDAHFKLDPFVLATQEPRAAPRATTTTAKTTTTTTAPAARATTGSSACTDQVDQRKLADEYCSSSWASLCTFFFSMVQSGDC